MSSSHVPARRTMAIRFISLLLLCCNGVLLCQALKLSRGSQNFQLDQRFRNIEYTYRHNVDSSKTSIFDVTDFGAVGDAKTDNTHAFQSALDAANKTNGGTVLIPVGNFLFKGSLTVPEAVTLQGTYKSVPAHIVGQHPSDTPTDGTILMPTDGKGNESGNPFISLTHNSVLCGVTIYYPDQPGDRPPTPFPWTVDMTGANSAVTDVECLNCFNAIRAIRAARHYIARVQGQPTNTVRTGIFIDENYDIGRVEDVHFNPWYSHTDEYIGYQLLNGRSFVFGRTDWEYVFNTFSFGYAVGYHFTTTSTGSCNGNFLGIGADKATNASVLVESTKTSGIIITNGEFTAFDGVDSTQIVVNASNAGSVHLVNSAFWGPSNSVAKISGSGTTAFSDCTFVQWDHGKKGLPAIDVNGATGNLQVTNCDFQHNGNHIDLGQKTLARAIITGNVMQGTMQVSGKAHNTQIGLNADGNPN